jgi:hypothetical protein
MSDNRSNVEKIKSIFLDYSQGIYWLEISIDDLDIIAARIEKDVMGIQDDNEFANVKDISKNNQ